MRLGWILFLSLSLILVFTPGCLDGSSSSDSSGGGGGGDGRCTNLPTCFDDLYIWLKADALVTTTGGTTVTDWGDSSGNDYDVVDGGTEALLVSNAVNSKPALRFAGVATYSNGTSLTLTGDINATVFIVTEPDDTTSQVCPIGWGDPSSSGRNFAMCFSVGTTGDVTIMKGLGFGRIAFDTYSSDWQIFALRKAAGSWNSTTRLWRNGTERTQQSTSGATTTNISATSLSIGQYTQGGYRYQGDIAEIIIYSDALTDLEIDYLNCYLANRYNITVSTSCN